MPQQASMSSAPPLNQQRSLTPRGHKLNAVLSKPSTDLDTSSGITSRRRALQSLIASSGATSLAFVGANSKANALDMDAFVNSQLESDTTNCNPKTDSKCKPKLTEDEALCKYGQSGEARAAACKRVRASGGAVPTRGSEGKSLGGAYAL